MQELKEENHFLQRLIEDASPRSPSRRHPSPDHPTARQPNRPAVMVALGHPAQPDRRARAQAGLRALPRHLGRRRRLQRRLPHPEPPAEPVRRRRALGVLHPGLRAAPRARGRGARRAGWPARWRRCWRWSPRSWCSSASWPRPGSSTLIAPGFNGEKRELTIRLVRILFPGAGLLVLSAWCLGVLNSHRRFFLSYAAPVVWNVAMIARADRASAAGRAQSELAIDRGLGLGRRAALLQFARAAARRCCGCCSGSAASARPRRRSTCATVAPQLPAGLRRAAAWCRSAPTSTRVHREPPAHRRRRRAGLRADALHAAGEPLRHVGLGGRAAGDVGRHRRPMPSERDSLRGTARRRAAADRVLRDPRRRWPSSRWATSSPRRSIRRARSPARTRLRLGHPRRLGGRAAGRRPWAGSTRRPSTRSTTRARRCASRSCGWCSRIALGYLFALPLPRAARDRAALGRGGTPASAGIAGWVEFLLLRGRCPAGSGATACRLGPPRAAVGCGGGGGAARLGGAHAGAAPHRTDRRGRAA